MDYTIQDLCDQTGVPRRTIHFYIQQQILTAPQGAGLGAHYQEEHLTRLKLIPILRHQGLKLDDIRLKFNTSSPAELEDLLAKNAAIYPVSPTQVSTKAWVKEKQQPPEAYECFTLPQGIMLFAPLNLHPKTKDRLGRLINDLQVELSQS